MLILSDGSMIGAVSGGCVEKEIRRQAETVFSSGIPKMMTYDGRYRLGCEGILFILIEPFEPNIEMVESFWMAVKQRKSVNGRTFYSTDKDQAPLMGTQFQFQDKFISLRKDFIVNEGLRIFNQKMDPCHSLVIIGAEHDAVVLCSYATMTGWEVTVVASPTEEKELTDFPGATNFLGVSAEDLDISIIDQHTSVILMTHSYVKDLSYLIRLKDSSPNYLGLLGPAARREKLLNEFLERHPDASMEFLENIYGPAGLHLGAETAQEIAISVVSEILSVQRNTQPQSLKNKSGAIHLP